MEAYCVKCRTKREMTDPKPVFTNNGTPATRGVCPECGTTMFRMGKTPAHEGMVAPKRGANRKGKLRRRGRSFGMTPSWKKAIVYLEPEYHIDLF